MSFNTKLGPSLCLVVLSNGPKEKPVYLPVCDYLFAQGYTPIEVRSPGEALIHTRQAKFSLVILPDEDHELIKKIKSPDGLNANTVIIAVSSAQSLTTSTQELLDKKVIQQVVSKTSNFEEFQKNLLEAVKCQMYNEGPDTKGHEVVMTTECPDTTKQWNELGTFQHKKQEHNEPSMIHPNTTLSNQLYVSPSQSDPCSQAGLPNQPYLPINQSGELFSSFPVTLQPFTLIPPMVVPYTSLLPGNTPYSVKASEGYMMPRIVDFSPNHSQTLPHMLGQPLTIPTFTVSQEAKPELVTGQSETSVVNVQNVVPDTTNDNIMATACNEVKSSEKLPAFQTFLECLCPGSKEDGKDGEKEAEEPDQRTDLGERAPKRAKTGDDQMQKASNKSQSSEEDEVDSKNPLSVLQARPYFMSLDEQIEEMAFDPTVKASDRHNAKERHRRIRISKAAEFFKEVLPCMHPGMDKAGAFHVTVYYIIFLRNALRQIGPSLVHQLHKTYVEEWKPYFDSTAKIDKQTD